MGMTKAKVQAGVALPCALLVFVVTMACGSDSGTELYLMNQHEARLGDRWFVLGGGCTEVGSGSASGGGTESHQISLTVDDSGGRLEVVVDGEVIVDRFFDRAFLESEQSVRVSLELPGEPEQRQVIWGGRECEPVHESEADEYYQATSQADDT